MVEKDGRKILEDALNNFKADSLARYDSGFTSIQVESRFSMVDATEPGDSYRHFEQGPTIIVTLTLHKPGELRPEIWA